MMQSRSMKHMTRLLSNNNTNHGLILFSHKSFHSNTLSLYARKKSVASTSKKTAASSSPSSHSHHHQHGSGSAVATTTTTETSSTNSATAMDHTGKRSANFLQNSFSDKAFARLATKSLEEMTPREKRLLKQQLEKNFLQNFRSNLMKDNAEVNSKVSDGEILDFARELTRGAMRNVPKSALQKRQEKKLHQSQSAAAANEEEEEDDYPSFTNVKKEVSKMTMEEKNSVYTFTLYRIMLKLISGKRLDRGNLRENMNEDAPLLSKSEQMALRREAKRQFLATAGITDQKQIISCFHRAEHAIHRFNAMQLGNHSLPPRTKSDIEKYKKIEEMGEPDSPIEKYWNEYYKQEGSLDEWYCNYEPLKNIFSQIQQENSPDGKPFHKALVLGCGMSSLGSELSTHSFATKITQIDISKFAIIHMQDAYKSLLKKQEELLATLPPSEIDDLSILEFKHADVREMEEEFEDEMFDIVVDKACLDSVLTSETGEIDIPDMEIEVWRVLKSHIGVWIIVSVLPQEGIESLLVQRPWKVDCVGSVPFAANQAQAHVYRLIKTHDDHEQEEQE